MTATFTGTWPTNTPIAQGPFMVALGAAIPQVDAVNSLVGTVPPDRITKIAKVALAALDTGGGVLSWLNPEATGIIITKLIVDVTTKSTGACSVDAGTTTVSAITAADNLIDGLDVGTTAGTFDTIDQAGANGKARAKLAAGGWLTISKDSGAAAGLVGFAYVSYFLV